MNFDYNVRDTNSLRQIAKITDEDFGLEQKENGTSATTRLGARGIVLDDEGHIAVIHKAAKNEYKLPGGGVDDGETPADAFVRECREELGCIVEITEELGTTEEYKSQENFKQLSFVFVAKKTDELMLNNLTDKEVAEGTTFLWLEKTKALEIMKDSLNNLKSSDYDSVYRTKFMVLRDIRILEDYLNR